MRPVFVRFTQYLMPVVMTMVVLALNTVFFYGIAAAVAGIYVDGILPAPLAAAGVTAMV